MTKNMASEFFGDTGKDSITSVAFIKRVDESMGQTSAQKTWTGFKRLLKCTFATQTDD
jgi:hypothetical protein